jgi:uncharacterized protein YkwD
VRAHDRGVGIASFARRGRRIALAAALAALVAAPASAEARHDHLLSARAACPGAYAPALTLTPARGRHATLCLINHIRRRHGLRALRPMRALRRAAAGFAKNMVTRGFFGHVTPGGRDLVARLRAAGFIRPNVHWTVGENLAWGIGSAARPEEIVHGWMRSGPHRRNLLDRHFRRIGIGIDVGVPAAGATAAAKTRGGATYVVDFGTRSGP